MDQSRGSGADRTSSLPRRYSQGGPASPERKYSDHRRNSAPDAGPSAPDAGAACRSLWRNDCRARTVALRHADCDLLGPVERYRASLAETQKRLPATGDIDLLTEIQP